MEFVKKRKETQFFSTRFSCAREDDMPLDCRKSTILVRNVALPSPGTQGSPVIVQGMNLKE